MDVVPQCYIMLGCQVFSYLANKFFSCTERYLFEVFIENHYVIVTPYNINIQMSDSIVFRVAPIICKSVSSQKLLLWLVTDFQDLITFGDNMQTPLSPKCSIKQKHFMQLCITYGKSKMFQDDQTQESALHYLVVTFLFIILFQCNFS